MVYRQTERRLAYRRPLPTNSELQPQKGVPAVTKDPNEKQPTNVTTASHSNLEEEIRRRAYELYEARGCKEGRELDDWLRAEAEVAAVLDSELARGSMPT